MKTFFVPSNRVHSYVRGGGGACTLPIRPRIEPTFAPRIEPTFAGGADTVLVGGSLKMDVEAVAHANTKMYVVVDTAGIPILRGGKQITYECRTPSQAATRALGGFVRSSGIKLHGGEPVYPTSELTLGTTPEAVAYQRTFSTITPDAFKQYLIRVSPMGGGSVRSYVCNYVANTKPNAMELKGGMVVSVHAQYVSHGAHIPSSITLFESI